MLCQAQTLGAEETLHLNHSPDPDKDPFRWQHEGFPYSPWDRASFWLWTLTPTLSHPPPHLTPSLCLPQIGTAVGVGGPASSSQARPRIHLLHTLHGRELIALMRSVEHLGKQPWISPLWLH